MKTVYFLLIALLATMLGMGVGCGNSEGGDEDDTDDDTTPEGDGGPSNSEVGFVPITVECDKSKTCAGLEHPEDCIADFQLETLQGGSQATGYQEYVGFYGFHDYSKDDSELIPHPNQRGSEPAVALKGCDESMEQNFVLHMKGTGFSNWGAGIGLDWGSGGELNPDCVYEEDGETLSTEENKCLELSEANSNVLLTELEENEACQDENGDPDPKKIRCALYRRTIKLPRDLSAYKGIGFWILLGSEGVEPNVNVKFSVPQTTRWYGNPDMPEDYRLEEYDYGDGYCSNDDGENSTKCDNDFAYLMPLPEFNKKWEYREVLFKDTAISPHWGLQLDYESFPATRSIGIKFQFDMSPGLTFDFYLDDVHLIRK